MKKFIVIEGSKKDMEQFLRIAQAMNLTIEDCDSAETPVAQPKAEAKKSSTKTSTKTSKKSSTDQFPSALYKSTAKEFGCLSKKGICYKACRDIVYDVIGWDKINNEPCKPKLTKAQGKKAVAAKFKELGWK